LSRREVQQALQDLWEVKLSLGAVVRQEQAQSAALAPMVEEAGAAVQQTAVVNMDETGWRQGQRRAWLWTVVADTLTVFRIDRSRGGAVVDALLGSEFGGVVGSDRWSASNRFPGERRALCWAHLKRAFQGLVDRGGEAEPIGRWGLAEIERLFALWYRFRAGEYDRKALQRWLIPLQAWLGRLLRRGQQNPDRKAAALCSGLTKWWTALWTFARVEGVEPTNNVAERALRPGVLWRTGRFGSDSEAGSQFAERLLTVVACCRQQGRRLLEFLVAAGEAVLHDTAAPSLFPAPLGGRTPTARVVLGASRTVNMPRHGAASWDCDSAARDEVDHEADPQQDAGDDQTRKPLHAPILPHAPARPGVSRYGP
jgi:transposase